MKKILYMLIGAAIAILALGVVGFAYAQAQNPPAPQPPAADGTNLPRPGLGMLRGRMQNAMESGMAARAGMMAWNRGFTRGYTQGMFGPMHETMVAGLAEKLGLSVEALQEKLNNGERPYDVAKAQGLTDEQIQDMLEQAHDQALQAAVAAGTLTREQADLMDQHMEQMGQKGWQMGSFRGQRMGLGKEGPLHDYKVAAFAEALGLTVEQVEARQEAGETLWQIAEAQGLTIEEFRTKMIVASQNAINQALADGKITQEQADWMLQKAEQMGNGGFGRGLLRQGGCPGMGGNLPAQP